MAETAALDAHGIELITRLAIEAATPEIVTLDTSGLGGGLPEKIPVGFDAKTQTLKSVKPLIDDYRTAPSRVRGTAKVETLESFIDLVDRHKTDVSAIFGKTSWPEPKLTAVIDYFKADCAPQFAAHRIVYDFPLTDEFKAWVKTNRTAMEQENFAAFLEEHAAELAAPMDGERSEYERLFKEKMATPSEVIALSRHLEVLVSARAKQGIRLQTGERTVEYAEEHQNAKGEPIVVPGIFMVSVPAFIDGDAVRIPARLRYRVSGGKVVWFYDLYRWEFYLRERVSSNLSEAAKATDLPSYEGAPEA